MKKCLETECLTVRIFKNHSKVRLYNIFNNQTPIGQILGDDINKLLNEVDLNNLSRGKNMFRVSVKKLKTVIRKPNYNY
mgnify:CR=1 FL=1